MLLLHFLLVFPLSSQFLQFFCDEVAVCVLLLHYTYHFSALAYLKIGETVECIKSCDKALEISATSVKALYRKAQVCASW